jgi:broad specificity phosphatase PhoE
VHRSQGAAVYARHFTRHEDRVSTLVLVRHGKASAFSPNDYDALSEPGFAQARALGEHWAALEAKFDRVYVGPRKRHRQTHDTVLEVLHQNGRSLPEPIAIDELDEHQGIQLMFALLPRLAKDDPTLMRVVQAMSKGDRPEPRDVLSAFRTMTRRWARGELNHEDVETWADFRKRATLGLQKMTGDDAKGLRVVAFTSAGAIAAMVGHVLGVDDGRVLDLSWSLHNGSITELAFSGDGLGLLTFNGTPHLRDPALVTSV